MEGWEKKVGQKHEAKGFYATSVRNRQTFGGPGEMATGIVALGTVSIQGLEEE